MGTVWRQKPWEITLQASAACLQGPGAQTPAGGKLKREMQLAVVAGLSGEARAFRCTVVGRAARLLAAASYLGSRWCQLPP